MTAEIDGVEKTRCVDRAMVVSMRERLLPQRSPTAPYRSVVDRCVCPSVSNDKACIWGRAALVAETDKLKQQSQTSGLYRPRWRYMLTGFDNPADPVCGGKALQFFTVADAYGALKSRQVFRQAAQHFQYRIAVGEDVTPHHRIRCRNA